MGNTSEISSTSAGKHKRSRRDMEEHISSIQTRLERIETLLNANPFQNQGSPFSTVTEDPSDYGNFIRLLCPKANGSILPKPVPSSVADSILPRYSGEMRGNRILEADFKSWMHMICGNQCKHIVSFEDGSSRVGRRTRKVNFHVVLKGKPNVDFYSVAIFGLLSRDGQYNGNKEVGDLFIRLESLLNTRRCKVVGGLTNGIMCEWFVMEKHPGSVRVEVTPEYDFRESLCGLLIADPSSLHMAHHIDMKFDVIKQLGAGRTSSVYLINHKGEHCAGKFFTPAYRENKKHELKMLKILEGVKGVPTVVNEFLSTEDALFMKPIRAPLTAGMTINRAHKAVFSSIVDILRAAHQRGIVHRDVRLSNILLVGGPDGSIGEPDGGIGVMIIDWGFATWDGVETNFAGSVATGSDKVLKQLRSKESLQRTSEASEWPDKNFCLNPSGEGAAEDRPNAEASWECFNRFGKRTWTSAEAEVLFEDLNSTGRITRAKARMMELSSVMKESALSSEDVRRSDGEKPYEFSFHPSDDLVSLVRTLLMYACRDVEQGLRRLYKQDYEGHIKFWADEMQTRPSWHAPQKFAENCQYDDLKSWIHNYALNFMP